MKVLITTENYMYKDGERLYLSNSFKKVVERYAKAFGKICICTRVAAKKKEDMPGSYEEVTPFIDDYINIISLLSFVKGNHNKELEQKIKNVDLLIARVPSIVSYRAASFARKMNKTYMVEVVGCAWDGYWNYSLFGKLVAPIAFLQMKNTVKHATFATYVTEKFLQNRYPCSCNSIHCSNVFIENCDESVIKKRIDKINNRMAGQKIILMTTAAIDVAYKGQEYVIRAIPQILKDGINVEYWMAGYGNKERLLSIAKKCSVEEKVKFLGTLSHDDVLKTEDQVDIYIQPSLQEGLPRAVIEAMSRGCPTLGARTAGIPELIDFECVFKPASSRDIHDKVVAMVQADMRIYANRNFEKSKEYLNNILENRRNNYYSYIRDCFVTESNKH